jgi:hypothetical protein
MSNPHNHKKLFFKYSKIECTYPFFFVVICLMYIQSSPPRLLTESRLSISSSPKRRLVATLKRLTLYDSYSLDTATKCVHLKPATKQVSYNLGAEIQEVWHGLEETLSSIIKIRFAIQEAWHRYERSC